MLAAAVPENRSGVALGLGGLLRDVGFSSGAAATGLIIAAGGVRALLYTGLIMPLLSFAVAVWISLSKTIRTAVQSGSRTD